MTIRGRWGMRMWSGGGNRDTDGSGGMNAVGDASGRMSKMAVKDTARQVIDALPDAADMDDIIHALYLNAKFEHGEREIRQGCGVSHEAAKQRLKKWLR